MLSWPTGAATPVSGRMKPTLIGAVEAAPEAPEAAAEPAGLAEAAPAAAAEGAAAGLPDAATAWPVAAELAGAADGAALPPQAASRERARKAPARGASDRRVLFTPGIVQPARRPLAEAYYDGDKEKADADQGSQRASDQDRAGHADGRGDAPLLVSGGHGLRPGPRPRPPREDPGRAAGAVPYR